MRRWAWLAAGLLVAGGLAALGAARVFGRAGSRPATLVSVVTMWLAAWVLWSFAGAILFWGEAATSAPSGARGASEGGEAPLRAYRLPGLIA